MAHRMIRNLNLSKKVLLAIAGLAAIGLPVVVGFLTASQSDAQTTVQPQFEVASIKPSPYAGQGFIGTRVSGKQLISQHQPLAELIMYAYGIKEYQLSGGPSEDKRFKRPHLGMARRFCFVSASHKRISVQSPCKAAIFLGYTA